VNEQHIAQMHLQ